MSHFCGHHFKMRVLFLLVALSLCCGAITQEGQRNPSAKARQLMYSSGTQKSLSPLWKTFFNIASHAGDPPHLTVFSTTVVNNNYFRNQVKKSKIITKKKHVVPNIEDAQSYGQDSNEINANLYGITAKKLTKNGAVSKNNYLFENLNALRNHLPAAVTLFFGLIPPKPWRPLRFFKPYRSKRSSTNNKSATFFQRNGQTNVVNGVKPNFEFLSIKFSANNTAKDLKELLPNFLKMHKWIAPDPPEIVFLRNLTSQGSFFGPKLKREGRYRTFEQVKYWKESENIRYLTQYFDQLLRLRQYKVARSLGGLYLPKFERSSTFFMHIPPPKVEFRNVVHWRTTLATPTYTKWSKFHNVTDSSGIWPLKSVKIEKTGSLKLNESSIEWYQKSVAHSQRKTPFSSSNNKNPPSTPQDLYGSVKSTRTKRSLFANQIFQSVFNNADNSKSFAQRFFEGSRRRDRYLPQSSRAKSVSKLTPPMTKFAQPFRKFGSPRPYRIAGYTRKQNIKGHVIFDQQLPKLVRSERFRGSRAKRFKRSLFPNPIFDSVFNNFGSLKTMREKFFAGNHVPNCIEKAVEEPFRVYGVPNVARRLVLPHTYKNRLFAVKVRAKVTINYGVPVYLRPEKAGEYGKLPTVSKSRVFRANYLLLPHRLAENFKVSIAPVLTDKASIVTYPVPNQFFNLKPSLLVPGKNKVRIFKTSPSNNLGQWSSGQQIPRKGENVISNVFQNQRQQENTPKKLFVNYLRPPTLHGSQSFNGNPKLKYDAQRNKNLRVPKENVAHLFAVHTSNISIEEPSLLGLPKVVTAKINVQTSIKLSLPKKLDESTSFLGSKLKNGLPKALEDNIKYNSQFISVENGSDKYELKKSAGEDQSAMIVPNISIFTGNVPKRPNEASSLKARSEKPKNVIENADKAGKLSESANEDRQITRLPDVFKAHKFAEKLPKKLFEAFNAPNSKLMSEKSKNVIENADKANKTANESYKRRRLPNVLKARIFADNFLKTANGSPKNVSANTKSFGRRQPIRNLVISKLKKQNARIGLTLPNDLRRHVFRENAKLDLADLNVATPFVFLKNLTDPSVSPLDLREGGSGQNGVPNVEKTVVFRESGRSDVPVEFVTPKATFYSVTTAVIKPKNVQIEANTVDDLQDNVVSESQKKKVLLKVIKRPVAHRKNIVAAFLNRQRTAVAKNETVVYEKLN